MKKSAYNNDHAEVWYIVYMNMLSALYICCMEANDMNPDQTKGAVTSGSILFAM